MFLLSKALRIAQPSGKDRQQGRAVFYVSCRSLFRLGVESSAYSNYLMWDMNSFYTARSDKDQITSLAFSRLIIGRHIELGSQLPAYDLIAHAFMTFLL